MATAVYALAVAAATARAELPTPAAVPRVAVRNPSHQRSFVIDPRLDVAIRAAAWRGDVPGARRTAALTSGRNRLVPPGAPGARRAASSRAGPSAPARPAPTKKDARKGAPDCRASASRRCLGERLAHRLEHALGLERLDDEVAGAELDRFEHLGLLAQGGAHDHACCGVDLDDLLEGGEAVLLGHRDVEGRELGFELLEA